MTCWSGWKVPAAAPLSAEEQLGSTSSRHESRPEAVWSSEARSSSTRRGRRRDWIEGMRRELGNAYMRACQAWSFEVQRFLR